MKIAIIGGSGALGAALSRRLAKAGYPVTIGSRDRDKACSAAATIAGDEALTGTITGMGLAEAAAAGEIVFLTVPYAAHADTLCQIADAVAGKIVVDATVPLKPPKVGTVQLPEAGCAALEAAAVLGPDVRLVSALQNIGAEKLASDAAIDADVLMAANDAGAAETVRAILDRIGLRSWHIGPLANSAASEALTSVLIQINRRYGIEQAGIRITGKPRNVA